MNRKRIERLWRLEGHRVPPRRSQASGKKAQGTAGNAVWNRPAAAPTHVWSYDFMSGRTRDGAALRILNVVDEYTRVAFGCRVDRSIGASDVIAELERLFAEYGRPQVLRSDNGREFIAPSLLDWLAERGVQTAFIEKASPQQNPFVVRFNGTMRDELLDGEEFDGLLEARVLITNWIDEYNTLRPTVASACQPPSPHVRTREIGERNSPHTIWTSQPDTLVDQGRRRSPHTHGPDSQKRWTKPRGPVTRNHVSSAFQGYRKHTSGSTSGGGARPAAVEFRRAPPQSGGSAPGTESLRRQ